MSCCRFCCCSRDGVYHSSWRCWRRFNWSSTASPGASCTSAATRYALYVIHIPAYLFTRELYHRIDPMVPIRNRSASEIGLFIATAVALCLALADLNYRLLERPLRARGRRIAASFLATRRPANVEPQPDTSAAVVPSSPDDLRRT